MTQTTETKVVQESSIEQQKKKSKCGRKLNETSMQKKREELMM